MTSRTVYCEERDREHGSDENCLECEEGLVRPVVKLVGADGNAFGVLDLCRRAAAKAGWSSERWDAVRDEMTSGDYQHLLCAAMRHFDVQ